MCHKSAKHFLSWLLLLIPGYTALAQNSNKENIPYTRYGIGDLQSGANVLARGMGYQTAALINPYAVNTENPASYASLKLTTYELGLAAGLRTLKSGGNEYSTGTATLSYLNIGIPVGKHAGINLGLKPHSRVYYRMMEDTAIQGLGNNTYVHSGDGGLNYAFFGAAGTYGGFSLGVNAGYLFGTTRNSGVLQQSEGGNILSSEFSRYNKVGGLYWSAGAMYEEGSSLKLRTGATLSMAQELNVWQDEYWINFRTLGGVIDRDTTLSTLEQRGKMRLPLSGSIGVQLIGEDTWSVGAEFNTTQWSDYRNLGLSDSVTDRSMRLGVGGSFTPDATSLYNYLQRITYRLGGYYGKDYVRLRGTDIYYYAVTIGASLPFRRSADRIHTAFELGRRGTQSNGLVLENFYRFSLGISLNDRWFIKRKYD